MACGVDGGSPASIQGFYARLGLAVLGTVADGDCGLDVCCQMLDLRQTLAKREALRAELSDYLTDRVDRQWMQQVMAACQEISVRASPTASPAPVAPTAISLPPLPQHGDCCGDLPPPPSEPPPPEDPPPLPPPFEYPPPSSPSPAESSPAVGAATVPAVAAQAVAVTATEAVSEDAELVHKALAWATGLADKVVLEHVLGQLPAAVKDEQVRSYRASEATVAPKTDTDARLIVNPGRVNSRKQVANAFSVYLVKEHGWQRRMRIPYGAALAFSREQLQWPKRYQCDEESQRKKHSPSGFAACPPRLSARRHPMSGSAATGPSQIGDGPATVAPAHCAECNASANRCTTGSWGCVSLSIGRRWTSPRSRTV